MEMCCSDVKRTQVVRLLSQLHVLGEERRRHLRPGVQPLPQVADAGHEFVKGRTWSRHGTINEDGNKPSKQDEDEEEQQRDDEEAKGKGRRMTMMEGWRRRSKREKRQIWRR